MVGCMAYTTRKVLHTTKQHDLIVLHMYYMHVGVLIGHTKVGVYVIWHGLACLIYMSVLWATIMPRPKICLS